MPKLRQSIDSYGQLCSSRFSLIFAIGKHYKKLGRAFRWVHEILRLAARDHIQVLHRPLEICERRVEPPEVALATRVPEDVWGSQKKPGPEPDVPQERLFG